MSATNRISGYREPPTPITAGAVESLLDLFEPEKTMPEHRVNLPNAEKLLHKAAREGKLEAVMTQIASDADVNERTQTSGGTLGVTPLFLAARMGRKDIIERLFEAKADVNLKSGSLAMTPLHVAICNRHIEVIEYLVAKKADLEATDFKGQRPLYLATSKKAIEAMNVLIDAGADINALSGKDVKNTALHLAISLNNLALVNLLLQKGADTEVRNSNRLLPLYFAVETAKTEIIETLLRNGADVNGANDRKNYTALHFAAQCDQKDTCELLLQNGADIEAKTTRGNPPLVVAVTWRAKSVIERLINLGANVNARSNDGSILHTAVKYGSLEIVEFLLNSGADKNVMHPSEPVVLAKSLFNRIKNGSDATKEWLEKNKTKPAKQLLDQLNKENRVDQYSKIIKLLEEPTPAETPAPGPALSKQPADQSSQNKRKGDEPPSSSNSLKRPRLPGEKR